MQRTHRQHNPRRGAAVVVALVALAVAGVYGAMLLQAVAQQRGEVKLQYERAQAGWLASAGLRRAAAKLAADSEYRGETWTLTDDLSGTDRAVVAIEITPLTDSPQRRLVRVQARLGSRPTHQTQVSRETTLGVSR